MRSASLVRLAVVALLLLAGAPGTGPAYADAGRPDLEAWTMGGQNLANTRTNAFANAISPRNAGRLAPKWTAQVHGDVSSTPAVVDGAVYITDWGGFLTKLDAATGRVIWAHRVSEYDGIAGSISRTSPLVAGGRVFIGDMNDASSPVAGGLGAHELAIDARTGALVWNSQVGDHFAASITASPILYRGVLYQGVSSKEEPMSTVPSYPCCTFRGSVVALSAATGTVLWRTFTMPDNGGVPGGYSGGAVWSSTPALDPATGRLYVDTGNNYTVPASVDACQDAGGTPAQCLSPDDHVDSILALDTRTGRIEWATGQFAFDSWTASCLAGQNPVHCPPNHGADSDFGSGAQLFTVPDATGRPQTLVGAGQKSGVYWALDAATGRIVWATRVGPTGLQGGIQWGTATDGRRIYVAEADDQRVPYQLPDGRTIDFGSIAALDPATGRILWQVADPNAGLDKAALSAANGVLYAGSMTGHMYALDAATGRVLNDFLGQGSSIAGPAIVGDSVYWGNGYSLFGVGTPATTFYAFSLRR
ncbi:MAG TPA: PQQ-binding-like beta-propeller repeat protein [Candidatus Dormibacteraeota bacterium]|nr:PQQ-binding-like beta-propeller repeat protein [Candidatus Dormibacteraeota bacterium]